MNTVKIYTPAPRTAQPDLVKKIGKTTYMVIAHFNQNSRETMSEKIVRILRNEVSQSGKI